MKNLALALILLSTVPTFAAEKNQLTHAEVVEAAFDSYEVATTFRYICNGTTYENKVRGHIQVGAFVQVVNCSNLVVTKDRRAIERDTNHRQPTIGQLDDC